MNSVDKHVARDQYKEIKNQGEGQLHAIREINTLQIETANGLRNEKIQKKTNIILGIAELPENGANLNEPSCFACSRKCFLNILCVLIRV